MGEKYREYLVNYVGIRTPCDLVAYFFFKAFRLTKDKGTLGLIACNTISEGDTREVALHPIINSGAGSIYSAIPEEAWTGKAAVVTSRLHIFKGEWLGAKYLSGSPVSYISEYLSDREEWNPLKLKSTPCKASIGVNPLGMGFTVSEPEAMEYLKEDERYKNVLFPFVNGREFNSSPVQDGSRWIINFWDWDESECLAYKGLFEKIENDVKPERLKNNRKSYRDYWWHFAEKRPALFHAIGRGSLFKKHPKTWQGDDEFERVIALTRVSKTTAFSIC